MTAMAAARLGDEVAHGFGLLAMVAGAVAGAIVGAAVVGATVATGGAAVAIIAGTIAAGGISLGQLVKGLTKKFNLPTPASGVLMQGSCNVRFNSRPAMRASLDFAACSGLPFNHPGLPAVPIAEGSSSVRINGMPVARLGDKLMCGAHIKSGSPDILIGGASVQLRSIYDTEHWAEYSLTALGIFAIGVGGGAAFAAGRWAGLGIFSGITGGMMLGFEGIGMLGDRWGPGGRDILQGAAGLVLLGLGAKLARDKSSIVRTQALMTEADPARVVLGPATVSHPEEVLAMRNVLEKMDIEVIDRKGAMAYAPGLKRGEPGQMFIDPDASYSAWLHEYQHALDDQAQGWGGMRTLFDNDLRWQFEQNAYGKEIELMQTLERPEVVQQLRANLEAERLKIFGEGGE